MLDTQLISDLVGRWWTASTGSCHIERAGTPAMTVNAHFDGKVIVPDEPLNLPRNQALIVSIEPRKTRSNRRICFELARC
ncbi:MAG TPA: hypothetical protein VMH05_01720 [Bryobacteraceae bacterium]|nr:hypothetical protein [Bryobacteraceae bacterium]